MKNIVTGILAHVDSGKTTLSEAILYLNGTIRSHGRVDHGNTFLDTNEIEREKGITIFSKQAVMSFGDTRITLLDTPGHIDFSAETERTLSVLDYAILLVSGSDGVESHTVTLFKLLERYGVPTFIFVNKMDMPGTNKDDILLDIQSKLSPSCVEIEDIDSLVLTDEELMDEYLETGKASDDTISGAIIRRNLFPCFFGSALKLTGVSEFLESFDRYTKMLSNSNEFGAKVYKISRDDDSSRLTHLKVTGGTLKAKDTITYKSPDGNTITEKINAIRIYSGDKYTTTDIANEGMVCAVTGLESTFAGMGLGFEKNAVSPVLEPVLTYKLDILDNTDVHTALVKLRILEQEDPELHIIWNELHREIHLQLMGEVQIEILRRIIRDRFGMEVDFSEGAISYRETIRNTVEGVGHFEPLRHYSEVHLILEPLKRGQGIIFKTDCSEDFLDKNWQRLIMTHLQEKAHIGVLTGSPITDIKITLVSGKAHKKHTEGGDFREATYRAVRHGLMSAESVLLEPYYSYSLAVPTDCVGRAMTDLERMGAQFSAPELEGEMSVIKGYAPVSEMRQYHSELVAYTSGKGKLFTSLDGYRQCHNPDQVIASIGYDAERDTDNPAGSVFCAHGAGFTVPWQEVADYMHLESVLSPKDGELTPPQKAESYVSRVVNDEELLKIFEKTYGPIKIKSYKAMEKRIKPPAPKSPRVKKVIQYEGPTYLLVDGYNIIFAWEYLNEIARESLDAAREMLIHRLCNYQGYSQCELILVFDAYKVKGGVGSVEKVNNINVVYTKEAETADAYIEKVTHELAKKHRVRVATSDGMEQMIILGSGAVRITAKELLDEVISAEEKIRDFIKNMQ